MQDATPTLTPAVTPLLTPAQRHIAGSHPLFLALIARSPPPPPPSLQEPFEALIAAIAHQQLHARAARAILARFHALFPDAAPGTFPEPAAILALPGPALRACGFSAAKAAAIQDICAHAHAGAIPTATEAASLDDETLITRMLPIRGVGRWTIQMMLMTALARPDVLPIDDFGIQDGWRHLNGLAARPRPRELQAIGAPWAPHRSTAAWYLWRASDEARASTRP